MTVSRVLAALLPLLVAASCGGTPGMDLEQATRQLRQEVESLRADLGGATGADEVRVDDPVDCLEDGATVTGTGKRTVWFAVTDPGDDVMDRLERSLRDLAGNVEVGEGRDGTTLYARADGRTYFVQPSQGGSRLVVQATTDCHDFPDRG